MSSEPETNPIEISLYEEDILSLWPFVMLSAYLDDPVSATRLLEIEKAKGTRYWVARSAENIVGVIGLYWDSVYEVRLLEPPQIIDIAVLPEFRKRGIARQLVREVENFLAHQKEETVWLFTDGNDPQLVGFYLSLGFRLAGTIPDYWGAGSAKATFRKDL